MVDYDVIVIGAGPSGLAASEKIAENGISVLCLDKKQEIGVPVRCAEGLGLGWFKRLGIEPSPKFCNDPIYGACLYTPSGKKVEIRFPKISGYVIERRIFEKELARNAAKKGAKILTKTSVISAERQNGEVKIKTKSNDEEKEYTCKLIISAEGVEGNIVRQLGLNNTIKLNDIDSGYQYEMAGIDYENPDLINLFFGTELAPRGYLWIFPKGKNEANVGIGIGGQVEKSAKYYLDKFIESHEGLKKGSIIAVNSGAVPVGGLMQDMTADNLIAVGDAAHQVNPIHGGGIGLAMEGGRFGAEMAVKAVKENNFSHEFLQEYNKKWWEHRGNNLAGILKKRKMFENLKDEDFELLADTLSAEDVMAFAEGDVLESAKIVGKKLIKNPKLMTLMLKYLKN